MASVAGGGSSSLLLNLESCQFIPDIMGDYGRKSKCHEWEITGDCKTPDLPTGVNMNFSVAAKMNSRAFS
jgi:hypothetical protein